VVAMRDTADQRSLMIRSAGRKGGFTNIQRTLSISDYDWRLGISEHRENQEVGAFTSCDMRLRSYRVSISLSALSKGRGLSHIYICDAIPGPDGYIALYRILFQFRQRPFFPCLQCFSSVSQNVSHWWISHRRVANRHFVIGIAKGIGPLHMTCIRPNGLDPMTL